MDISALVEIYVSGTRVPLTEDGTAGLVLRAPDLALLDQVKAAVAEKGAADLSLAWQKIHCEIAAGDYVRGWWGLTINGEELADKDQNGGFHFANYALLLRIPAFVVAVWAKLYETERSGWEKSRELGITPKRAEPEAEPEPLAEEPAPEEPALVVTESSGEAAVEAGPFVGEVYGAESAPPPPAETEQAPPDEE